MDVSKPDKPCQCIACPKTFKNKQFLQRHMVSHTDNRDFQCQVCMKTYKYKKGLNRHIKKNHSNCFIECSKTQRKQFKVEDFLDLAEEVNYRPKKILDPLTGKEKEILFTWKSRKTILE